MLKSIWATMLVIFSYHIYANSDYGVDTYNVHPFQRSDASGIYFNPNFAWHNNKLYFSGNDGINDWQLWAYEPATEQSSMVARLRQSTGVYGADESSYPEIVNCGAGLFIRAVTMKDPFGSTSEQSVFYFENDNFKQIELPQNAVLSAELYSNGSYVLFLSWSDNQTRWAIFNCQTKQLQLINAPAEVHPWGPGFGGGVTMSGDTIIYHGSYARNNNVVNTYNIVTGVVTSVLPVNSSGVEFNQHRFITTPSGEVLLLSTMFIQPNGDIYLGKLNPVTGTVEQVPAAALTQLLAQQQFFKDAKYFEYQAKPGILLHAGSPAGLWFFDLSSYQVSNLGQLSNNASLLKDMTVKAGKIFYRHFVWDLTTFVTFDAEPDVLLPVNSRVGVDIAYHAGYWYFPAQNQNGVELWRYGDNEEAVQLTDSNTSLKSSFPLNFTAHNGRLFFSANTTNNPNANNTLGPSLFKVENPDLQPVPLPAMQPGNSELGLRRVFNLLGHNDSLFVTAQQNDTDEFVVGLYNIPDNSYQQIYTLSFEPLDYRWNKDVLYSFIYNAKYYAVLKYESNELTDDGLRYKTKTSLVWLDETGQVQLAVESMDAQGSGMHQFHLVQDMLFYESRFYGGMHHSSALNVINLVNNQRHIVAEDAALIEQQKVPL